MLDFFPSLNGSYYDLISLFIMGWFFIIQKQVTVVYSKINHIATSPVDLIGD